MSAIPGAAIGTRAAAFLIAQSAVAIFSVSSANGAVQFATDASAPNATLLSSQVMEGHFGLGATRARTTVDVANESLAIIETARDRHVALAANEAILRLVQAAALYETSDMPEVATVEHGNGSLFVEWILPGRRIGFTFDRDVEQSGWHYVSAPSMGGSVEHGALDELDVSYIVHRLMMA